MMQKGFLLLPVSSMEERSTQAWISSTVHEDILLLPWQTQAEIFKVSQILLKQQQKSMQAIWGEKKKVDQIRGTTQESAESREIG